MSTDQLPPDLQDFQTQLKTINVSNKTKKQSGSKQSTEDYTKVNARHIEDEEKFKAQQQKLKSTQVKIQKEIQKTKKKQDFGGFKKGFLSGGSSKPSQPKKQKIPQLKVTNKNPLQIKQVQDAMKMNNYLDQTRKQWMNNDFLNKVQTNQKINKLFTNPQYMKAIDMFKTNPRQALAKYGNNKEFMDGFQEFCKIMGMQFQNLAAQSKVKK